MAHLLVVDDEPAVTSVLATFFERNGGHTVTRAYGGQEGIDRFLEEKPDLVLLDLRMPDISGFEVLQRLREHNPTVIIITAHGDVPVAVEAMRNGAENFLTKPVDLPHLSAITERALEKARLKRLNAILRTQNDTKSTTPLLGNSPAMRELAKQVELLAANDKVTGLLTGEVGVGKGRVAQLIHALSVRAKRTFVEVHCAALSGRDLESELFGYESGAFGDSAVSRRGAFEIANMGTVFLDEVSALPPDLQAKLLGVLEGRGFRRIGSAREIYPDVHVLAATSKDLVVEVNAGRFREDLYYCLSVMPMHLPPLRSRAREDLAELIATLIAEKRVNVADAPPTISDDALEYLLTYPWPGNVSELHTAIERALLLSRGAPEIKPEHLPVEVRDAWGNGSEAGLPKTLIEMERVHISRTLRAHNLNRTHAAKELGISRATLIKKIKEFGLLFRSSI